MNIIKRLLNAFVLIGAVLILIGFGFGVNEYLQSLKERVGACEQQVEIDEILSEFGGIAHDPPAYEARSRCNSESQIYEIFSDEIGILFGGSFLLLLLNYFLFGKFTLWHRVADTQKSDDGKS